MYCNIINITPHKCNTSDGVLKEHQDLSLVTSDLLLMKAKLERLHSDETAPNALLSASTELAPAIFVETH